MTLLKSISLKAGRISNRLSQHGSDNYRDGAGENMHNVLEILVYNLSLSLLPASS